MQKTDLPHYDRWKPSHNCNLNYRGSAPNMEKVGATNIFERSVQKHGLYYTSFYGDGENVYGPVKPVTKYECIGHYQKRVRKRVGNGSGKLRKEKKLGGTKRSTTSKNGHSPELFWNCLETMSAT